MRYVKDFATGSVDPVVIDYLAEADTYKLGECAALGLADGDDLGFAKSGEGAVRNGATAMLGVFNEAITSTLDIDDATTHKPANFAKICVNPYGIWEAEYSQAAADDITLSGELDYACTSDKGQPQLGGSWMYVVSGTAAGELYLIEDSSTTSTTCTVVLAGTAVTATDNTSNVVFVYGPGQHVIKLGDTDIVQGVDADYDVVVSTGTYGMPVYVLSSFIRTDAMRKRELSLGPVVGQGLDDGRTGLDDANVKFYSQIMFGGLSHAFNVAVTRS